jgi:hypothetical protein
MKTAGQLLAEIRWAGTTPAQRKAELEPARAGKKVKDEKRALEKAQRKVLEKEKRKP